MRPSSSSSSESESSSNSSTKKEVLAAEQNSKSTEVCRDFANGVCQRHNCKFLHKRRRDEEKKKNEDSFDPTVCRDFVRGECSRGSSCKFVHPSAHSNQPQAEICKDFQKGFCDRVYCKFLHASLAQNVTQTPPLQPVFGKSKSAELGPLPTIAPPHRTFQSAPPFLLEPYFGLKQAPTIYPPQQLPMHLITPKQVFVLLSSIIETRDLEPYIENGVLPSFLPVPPLKLLSFLEQCGVITTSPSAIPHTLDTQHINSLSANIVPPFPNLSNYFNSPPLPSHSNQPVAQSAPFIQAPPPIRTHYRNNNEIVESKRKKVNM